MYLTLLFLCLIAFFAISFYSYTIRSLAKNFLFAEFWVALLCTVSAFATLIGVLYNTVSLLSATLSIENFMGVAIMLWITGCFFRFVFSNNTYYKKILKPKTREFLAQFKFVVDYVLSSTGLIIIGIVGVHCIITNPLIEGFGSLGITSVKMSGSLSGLAKFFFVHYPEMPSIELWRLALVSWLNGFANAQAGYYILIVSLAQAYISFGFILNFYSLFLKSISMNKKIITSDDVKQNTQLKNVLCFVFVLLLLVWLSNGTSPGSSLFLKNNINGLWTNIVHIAQSFEFAARGPVCGKP